MTPAFAMLSYCPKSFYPTHPEDQWFNLSVRLLSSQTSFSPYGTEIPLSHTPSDKKKPKRQDWISIEGRSGSVLQASFCNCAAEWRLFETFAKEQTVACSPSFLGLQILPIFSLITDSSAQLSFLLRRISWAFRLKAGDTSLIQDWNLRLHSWRWGEK